MIANTHPLWSEQEYTYPLAFGFVPNIVSYIHDEDSAPRPAILVVPGGGYCVVAPSEGEIVALSFYDKGYNTFVLTYTTDILLKEPLKLQPIQDLSRALRYVRKNAGGFHVDPSQLAICGFSAGGHLSASVTVHYEDIQDQNPLYQPYSNRPDAVILSYPVITSGEKAHRGSFTALLGPDASESDLHYMSLEHHVKPDTPPVFLWQTVTDETVPVENSYLFARACKDQGVFHEHHVFSDGAHGLSLANDLWFSGKYGKPYTMEQTIRIANKGRNGELQVSQDLLNFAPTSIDDIQDGSAFLTEGRRPDPSVAMWPALADLWLKKALHLSK